MVALSRCLGAAVAFAAVDGARVSKKGAAPETKFLGGVPVLNYHKAYTGESFAETSESCRGSGISCREDWMVVAKRGTTTSELTAMCRGSGMTCRMQGHPSAGGAALFEVSGTEAELEKVLGANKGLLKFAEPVMIAHAIPEEAPSTQAAKSWGLDRVNVNEAPNKGAGVNIYVLDTGVRTTHTDFGARAKSALDFSTDEDGEVCNGRLDCAADNQGHGTHCAGTAAGATYGIAREAKIFGVKVLGDDGSGSFAWSFSALDYLAGVDKPVVASMSLGGQGIVAAMEASVDAAVDAGVTVVVAGGNSNSDACGFSPAYVPSAITVGSTAQEGSINSKKDVRSSFSNYGRCTDIWAPGSDITSASHASDTGSATMSGTSMACPHVSGASALILSASPSLKSPAVLQSLLDNSYYGYIHDLREGDVNNMLYVGGDGKPEEKTPPPTSAPSTCPYDFCGSYCWYEPCAACDVCR